MKIVLQVLVNGLFIEYIPLTTKLMLMKMEKIMSCNKLVQTTMFFSNFSKSCMQWYFSVTHVMFVYGLLGATRQHNALKYGAKIMQRCT